MKFNINDMVRVRLTDHGRAVHKADHFAFWAGAGQEMEYRPPVEGADGWSEWPMHWLMYNFGRYTTCGSELCFETTIELVEREPLARPQDPMAAVRAMCG